MVADTLITLMIATATATTTPPIACAPGRSLTPCESQIMKDASLWRERALVTRERYTGCAEKLAIRSSSVAETLAPCTPPPPAIDWGTLIGTTGGSLLIGAILGVILTR